MLLSIVIEYTDMIKVLSDLCAMTVELFLLILLCFVEFCMFSGYL